MNISVRIDSSRPIFMEADAESFADVFTHMNAEEQAEVLRLIFAKLKEFPLQLDYIGMELQNSRYDNAVNGMDYLVKWGEQQ